MPLRGRSTRRLLFWVIAVAAVQTQRVQAHAVRYSSGLLRTWTAPGDSEVYEREALATERFLAREFAHTAPFHWKQVRRTEDTQHVHFLFELRLDTRRVVGHHLKIHFNKEGFLQYASSDWEEVGRAALPAENQANRSKRMEEIRSAFVARHGRAPGRLDLQPVIWVDRRDGHLVGAYEVVVTAQDVGVFRRYFISETTGEHLQEMRVSRGITANIYKKSPFGAAPFDSVTLPGLAGGATSLSTSELHVWRDQLNGVTSELAEVDPTFDFSASITANPATYDADCYDPSTAACPNQGFEAQQVFYHLQSFRNRVDSLLAQLGSTVTFASDPLQVLINSRAVDVNGDLDATNDVNNAAFMTVPCRDGFAAFNQCLVFLRPLATSSLTCGGMTTFYSLAREALVAVHEYQHYVTDSISQMESGSVGYNVGDALHEGYSDYFAATHVSQDFGSDVTLVGEYAFQNCAAVLRDVGVLTVYDKNSADPGPHSYGLSWASGLWQLRRELGAATVDAVALKSLFLLPTRPGFMDAVEALVQADLALNQGANRTRIRELFYDEIKFIAGYTGQFRDTGRAVVEMGLRSCASVPAVPGANGWATALTLLTWIWVTLGLGRQWRKF